MVLLLFKYIWLGNTGKNKARLTPNLAWIKMWWLVHRCEPKWRLVLQNKQLVSLAAFHLWNYGVSGRFSHQWCHNHRPVKSDWFVQLSVTCSSTFISARKKLQFPGLAVLRTSHSHRKKKENYLRFIFSAWLLSVYGVKQAVLFLWLNMLLMICILGDNRLHKDSVNYKRENCLCCTKCNTHLHGWRKGII